MITITDAKGQSVEVKASTQADGKFSAEFDNSNATPKLNLDGERTY